MRKHFIMNICEHLDPCINERVGQVTLEIERNPRKYKEYAGYDAAYERLYHAFAEKHPDKMTEVDDLIASFSMCNSVIANEAYKRGARDGALLLQRLGLLNERENEKEDDPV